MFDIAAYDFDLPQKLIAQHPRLIRDECRLMVVNRKSRAIGHMVFKNLVEQMEAGDVLVLNDTKVLAARLFGKKIPSGGRVEILLLDEQDEGRWRCLVRKGKTGCRIRFEDGLEAEILQREPTGEFLLAFDCDANLLERLNKMGLPPLPPYIKRQATEDDRKYYQTVYARKMGSVAAPTAGLHFTPSLLSQISEQGVHVVYVLLHIGMATFKPVKVKDIREHEMGSEEFELDYDAADTINAQKDLGKKIIGVGTSMARVVETLADGDYVRPGKGSTEKFIYPPYKFQILDGLLTNFHLPRSTPLLMVSAFAGRDLIMEAYAEAIEHGYRFYTYGDAMLIL